MTLYTIGHSNRGLEEFIEMLAANDVECLVDVRRMPRSRSNPQFNGNNLAEVLPAQSITYLHAPGLAGLRKGAKDSINAAWRNKSFRAYADYMQTRQFAQNLNTLLHLANKEETAVMCAEAVPWRCHRSLIADAAVAKGCEVINIMSVTKSSPHQFRDFARINRSRVYYPAQ